MGMLANLQVKNLLTVANLPYKSIGEDTIEVDNVSLSNCNSSLFYQGLKKLADSIELVKGDYSLLIQVKQ